MTSLNKKKVLITSGPTRCYLDVVRYITNTSTGKLGTEIALEAMRHGATVTFLYGKDSLFPLIEDHTGTKSSQLKLIEIETNSNLVKILQERLRKTKFDAIVHAMAIADYVPAKLKTNKISSGKEKLIVKFVRAPKVIDVIREIWPKALLVGFKLEVNKTKEELIKISKRFMKRCTADLIVANDYRFISENRHIAHLISSDYSIMRTLKSKQGIAKGVIEYIEKKT